MSRDDREARSTGRRNAPPRRLVERSYVTQEELRSAYRGKKAFSLRDTTILVKTPYSERVRAIMHNLNAKWDSKHSRWEVHAAKHPELKQHIEEIEQIVAEDWHDRLNSTLRESERDKRVWVAEADLGDYEEGLVVFHQGAEWTVSYVGRAKEMGSGEIRYAVYLARYEPEPLALPAHGFGEGDDQ